MRKFLTLLCLALIALTASADVTYTNGFGDDDSYEPATLVDGYYLIDNGGKLFWLAQQVNSGAGTNYDAKLTADIDLENRAWTPMGDDTYYHAGEFDGQGHSVTGLSITADAAMTRAAFIGYHNSTKDVHNFNISGSITATGTTSNHYAAGVIAWVKGSCNVRDIWSSVNITNLTTTTVSLRMAGIATKAQASTINRCVYDGTITGEASNLQVAGILGWNDANNTSVTNCLFAGTLISTGTESNSAYLGGILGYAGNYSGLNCSNNLSIGTVTSPSNATRTGALVGNNTRSLDFFVNNYVLQGLPVTGTSSTKIPSVTEVTTSELADGSLPAILSSDNWSQGPNYPIPADNSPITDADLTIDGIKYAITSENTVKVTYPNASQPSSSNPSTYSGDITIPASVRIKGNTFNVTAIGDYAFWGAGVTSLTLPEGITSLGYKSIYNTQITEITLPNSVVTMDYEALGYNTQLVTINFGENIATNTWGDKLCYNPSGTGLKKEVNMYCDAVPTLQSYTFDFAKANVHVRPAMVAAFKANAAWSGYDIIGDLAPRNYTELQDYITYYESVTPSASEIGTSFGQYSTESVAALTNAINTAKGLDNTASLADVESAAAGMYTAYNNLYMYSLDEGYYYIRCEYYTNYAMYTDASTASEQGLKTQTFTESKMNTVDYLKYCFKFTKNGENWNIQSAENGMYFGTTIGSGDQKYISLTDTPTYQQIITPISQGKLYIQSIYDDNSITYPYSYYNYRVMTWKSEHNRRYWSIHPLPVEVPDVEVIDGIATIAQSGITALAARIAVLQAKFNGATAVDFSGSTFASDVKASTLQVDAGNMVVVVPASSNITGQNIVKDGTCSDLVLTDGQSFGAPTDFTAATATYTRTMSNEWGTICLPYDVSSSATTKYYTISAIENSALVVSEVATLTAGTPGLVQKVSGDAITATAANVPVSANIAAPSGTVKMYGVYERTKVEDPNAYYIKDNKFWQCNNFFYCGAFRAYFTTSGAGSNSFSIVTDNDDPTAIASAQAGDNEPVAIYSTDGTRLGTLRSGINIVKQANGKTLKIQVK